MRATSDVLKTTLEVFTSLLRARDVRLPQRQIIVAGELAFDCAQFAVWTSTGAYAGFPGSRLSGYQSATGGFVPLSMDVNVSLLRDVLNIDNAGVIPRADDLTRASLCAADDADALAESFWTAYNANTLAYSCDNLTFAGITFTGPLGGILETRASFSIQL